MISINGIVDSFSHDTLNVMGNALDESEEFVISTLSMSEWPISVFAIIVFLFVNHKTMSFVSKHLKMLAILIWLAGLVLYMVGFNAGGCKNNAFALFLRASLSSMEMFVSRSSLKEVMRDLHGNPVYMAIFSFVHFCAVVVSTVDCKMLREKYCDTVAYDETVARLSFNEEFVKRMDAYNE